MFAASLRSLRVGGPGGEIPAGNTAVGLFPSAPCNPVAVPACPIWEFGLCHPALADPMEKAGRGDARCPPPGHFRALPRAGSPGIVMETPQNSEGTASPSPLQTIGTAHPATGQGWAKGCPLLWGGGEQRDPITPLTAPLPRRMSMRSPVSPHLELDGAGSMVNCTIKTEEKKEGGYESPPGAAPSAEPRPSDPPGPPPREGTDPQALPQVGPTAVTPPPAPWSWP